MHKRVEKKKVEASMTIWCSNVDNQDKSGTSDIMSYHYIVQYFKYLWSEYRKTFLIDHQSAQNMTHCNGLFD